MHVVRERPGVTLRTWTALALLACTVPAPLCAQRQDTVSRSPVQRATVIFSRIDSALRAAGVRVDSGPQRQLATGCQVVRGTVLGVAVYEGIAVGGLTDLTVRSWNGPRGVVLGAQALGAAAAVLWALNEPLPRPLPMCPAGMRTVSGRAPNAVVGCRAAQLTGGMVGLHGGSVAAVGLVPIVTVVEFLRGHSKEQMRRDRRMILVGLPLAGAAVGTLEAQRRRPCSTS